MIQTLKLFLEQHINWIEILLSLIVNLIFIITLILSLIKYIKRRMLFRVKRNQEGLYALSIGMGRNDPYNAVLDYLKEENKDKIIRYHKFHKRNKEKDLTQPEVQSALNELESAVGSLRRLHFKSVLIFCATPVAAAIKIGYFFRNFPGNIKLMHWNRETQAYEVLTLL